MNGDRGRWRRRWWRRWWWSEGPLRIKGEIGGERIHSAIGIRGTTATCNGVPTREGVTAASEAVGSQR